MIVPALIRRELRLWRAQRAQLLTLAAYPFLLLVVGALALDLPVQGGAVRAALLLIAFLLLPLTLVPLAWAEDMRSGALLQLRDRLWAAVAARYAVFVLLVMLPLTLLLLAGGMLLLNLEPLRLALPMLLAIPSLTGLLLLVAALTAGHDAGAALPALLLLPLAVPAAVLLTLGATAPAGLAAAALWWLAALAALSIGLLPPAIAAVLRHRLAI